ncbi:hypothetical protein BVI434_150013 [Burkholderia vietnamiensis]|nr:hypothetical protein BVI434_150013 [Burkholderia vietnamiensis]
MMGRHRTGPPAGPRAAVRSAPRVRRATFAAALAVGPRVVPALRACNVYRCNSGLPRGADAGVPARRAFAVDGMDLA